MPGHFEFSRRQFLALAAASLSGATDITEAAPVAALTDQTLLDLSAISAVAHMTRGELSAERYATALIARSNATAQLNAFITFEPEQVLEDARARDLERHKGMKCGPLFGLPIPVKDSVNTAAYATTAGTPALRNFRPGVDAPLVATLKQAGGLVLGKTNLHELSFGWTSNNQSFGAVHNPYDFSRIPGGSSGGTAAAVAAHVAPLGVAEDTEGSIRVPAACCGLTGFRPTTGRYSTEGCVPISPLFDQTGPLARTVGDLALFDSVAANDWRPLKIPSLKGVRLAVVRDYWFTDLDPQIAALTEQAIARMQAAGIEIVEATLPGLEPLIALTTYPVQNHDARIALEQYLREYRAGVDLDGLVSQASADIRSTFRSDVMLGGENFVSGEQYAAARFKHLPALRALFRHFFESNRVAGIVFPTLLVPPPPIGMDMTVAIGSRLWPLDVALARNIAPASTAGIPGLVLPIGMTQEGLPAAIEIDGPTGGDRALLGLGSALERVFGTLPPPRL